MSQHYLLAPKSPTRTHIRVLACTHTHTHTHMFTNLHAIKSTNAQAQTVRVGYSNITFKSIDPVLTFCSYPSQAAHH